MKYLLPVYLLLLVACAQLPRSQPRPIPADQATNRPQPARQMPNVVILYGDDVGYGDVGAYGSTKIPTPRIDALAGQGLTFLDAHSAASTCTPSRYALLTGEMAFRQPGNGIAHALANMLIKPERFTLADLFKNAGYNTAVVGKWHLGLDDQPIDWNNKIEPGPESIGFDHHFIMPATNDRLPAVYVEDGRVVNLDLNDPITVQRGRRIPDQVPGTAYPDAKLNPEAVTAYPGDAAHSGTVINGLGRIGYMKGGKSALWKDEALADDFVREANAWIDQNKDRPFFLFFSANDIHAPRWPHERFRGRSEHGLRGDAMVSFDWSVGAVLDHLDKLGLADNTIVILASDNGPVYIDGGYQDGGETIGSSGSDRGHDASGPFRGGKYQLYEGGTRTPFIVRWPGEVVPGVSDALVSQVDLLASFAALLDQPIPRGEAIDSRDLSAALLGKDTEGAKVILEQANNTRVAMRYNHWKYIPGDKPEMFNLAADIGETDNLIDKHPAVADYLGGLMQRYQKIGLSQAGAIDHDCAFNSSYINSKAAYWPQEHVAGKVFDVDIATQRFDYVKNLVYDPQTGEAMARHCVHWSQATEFIERQSAANLGQINDGTLIRCVLANAKEAQNLAEGKLFSVKAVTAYPLMDRPAQIEVGEMGVVGSFVKVTARSGRLVIDGRSIDFTLARNASVEIIQRFDPADLAEGSWQALVQGAEQAGRFVANSVTVTALPDPTLGDKAGLPRVLIIGDSISMNYHDALQEQLEGVANLHRIQGNAYSSQYGMQYVDYWLGDFQKPGLHWDVIQFNHGLHDLKQTGPGEPYAISPVRYKAYLRRMIKRLKRTGATLIWCSTTPVPNSRGGRYGRQKDAEDVFNKAAREVMAEHPEILINDLCAVVDGSPVFDTFRKGSDVHYYKDAEKAVLGKAVADAVKAALERR